MATVGLKITPQPLCWRRATLLMMLLCSAAGTQGYTCPFVKYNRPRRGRLLSRHRSRNELMCLHAARVSLTSFYQTGRNRKKNSLKTLNVNSINVSIPSLAHCCINIRVRSSDEGLKYYIYVIFFWDCFQI